MKIVGYYKTERSYQGKSCVHVLDESSMISNDRRLAAQTSDKRELDVMVEATRRHIEHYAASDYPRDQTVRALFVEDAP
jgi:hypothetical protein